MNASVRIGPVAKTVQVAPKLALAAQRPPTLPLWSDGSGRLQRRCACGGGAAKPDGASADCESCQKKAGAGLQRKLTLGDANDAFEAEADRIADRVVGSAAQALSDAPCAHTTPLAVQRRASDEESAQSVPPIVGEVLSASAQPLDGQTRSFMEGRFGHDFGHVRIHLDAKAADSARSVAAQAYTVGSHIVFGAGRYAPGTDTGRRLLAHELTHVVQQTGTLARQPAPSATKSQAPKPSPSQRVVNLATVLEMYANRADARVAASREGATAIRRVRVHLGELRAGIEQLRQLAAGGDSAACAAALSGFTETQLRLASRSLVPAGVQSRVAITEQALPSLATKSLEIGAGHGAAEAEADRVADAVVNGGGVPIAMHAPLQMQRYLDAQAMQQAQQNLPVITAAAGVTIEGGMIAAGAIAAGGGPPGWVIGLAIVAVVAVVAVGGYLYYRSQSPDPEVQPQPQPQPQPQVDVQPREDQKPAVDPRTTEKKRRRDSCFERNPGAIACDEPVWDGDEMRDERVAEFLYDQGYSFADFTCTQFGAPIGAGRINDCDGAPAIGYHCRVKGTSNVVSIFACLCCDAEGNSRFQWSRPHWSVNQSQRGPR